jgi:hypothetical protein
MEDQNSTQGVAEGKNQRDDVESSGSHLSRVVGPGCKATEPHLVAVHRVMLALPLANPAPHELPARISEVPR